MTHEPTTGFGHFIDEIEETSIAILLGLMTLITFANVIARYVFNENLLWALEGTVFLFAWLVLMGASYGVKKHIHIGVDVIINMVSPPTRKIMALFSVGSCLAFALALTYGAWTYWYPFVSELAFMETEDIPMPEMLMFLADWLNEGERYEKLPRFIPYFALPLGMTLFTYRFLQLGWRVWTGELNKIITSHEVEDELEELQRSEGFDLDDDAGNGKGGV